MMTVAAVTMLLTMLYIMTIKLCPRGAQTCALPLFCDRDLEINPMTLKLNRDLDILKMNLQTENEVARSSHSKYISN